MSRQGQRQFILVDAAAVVTHPDALPAALLDIDLDAAGTGIQAVLQQFLDHGRRPLDDLAGGDLVDQLRGQYLNTHQNRHRDR